jgi:phage terminase large subunit
MPEKLSDGTREREPKFMCLALDWGFSNDPTAVVALWEGLSREVKTQSGVILNKPEVYVREMLYQTGLTNPEVAEKLKGIIKELKLPESAPVVCDSADPKSIEEVRRAGINAVPASKGPDSVRMGIQLVNQHVHIVDPFSENWQKEARSYKYQMDKNGKVTNVPVDRMNHLMDATRYGDDYWFNNRYTGEYVIS